MTPDALRAWVTAHARHARPVRRTAEDDGPAGYAALVALVCPACDAVAVVDEVWRPRAAVAVTDSTVACAP